MATGNPPTTAMWTYARAVCWTCQHRWVAVFQVGTPRLECPRCGLLDGQPANEDA